MAEHMDWQPLDARAWELCYLQPMVAKKIGHQLIGLGGEAAAAGWVQVALVEVRLGQLTTAEDALQRARLAGSSWPDALRSVYCDEIAAIALRREGRTLAAAQLQAEIDARHDLPTAPIYRFIALNARAITAQHLGAIEPALRLFYAAMAAAIDTGWPGPRITASSNLAGYHTDLCNFDDARQLSEKALAEARAAAAPQVVTFTAANLILLHHAVGDMPAARDMVDFFSLHADEMLPHAQVQMAPLLALAHLGVGEIDLALQRLEQVDFSECSRSHGLLKAAWVKTRCLLAKGEPALARQVADETLYGRRAANLGDATYDVMFLHRALSDACEQVGDAPAALSAFRIAYEIYEQMAGRSARARFIALEVDNRLKTVQHERDAAIDFGRSADGDRRRLTALNAELQAKIAETDLLHAKLREQALRDPLTGLHNRRYLFETAPGLLDLARRRSEPLCVVLMDLDHFKLLNDTYGHDAGDRVLQRFSALLAQTLRKSDVVVRHGGEEFVAVMPGLDGGGAAPILERLLDAYQSVRLEFGRRRLPHGSFSAGVAVFPRHGHTLEQLLMRADRSLYAAKDHGRARIEWATPTNFVTLV